MICNNPKCYITRQGICHDSHMMATSSSTKWFAFNRTHFIILIIGILVASEVYFVHFTFSYLFVDLHTIGSFPEILINTGIAVFLAFAVYLYSKQSERDRKRRLQMQVVSSFLRLSQYFSLFTVPKSPHSIDEQRVNIKNMQVFLIENLIAQLPIRLSDEMSITIPDILDRALFEPNICKSDDPIHPITIDYSQCDKLIRSIDEIMGKLKQEWNIKY